MLPATLRSSSAGPLRTTGVLPTELSDHRQTRLGQVALLYSLLFLIGWVAQAFLSYFAETHADPMVFRTDAANALLCRPPLGLYAATLSVAGSLVFWIQSRRQGLSEAFVCGAGLRLQVLGAFGITMAEQWATSGADSDTLLTGSWVAVWIVLFPTLVPTFPKRALIGALVAATMVPTAWALNQWSGALPQGPLQVAALVFPGYLAAIASFFASKFIYDLGASASRAKRMGAYDLGESIGAGGMGEVWRAEHGLLKRPAAVKLIRPDRLQGAGDSPEAVLRRFAREAKATAVLESPHTVTIYDYGVTDEGTFYYVMELLNGMDLETLVRRFGPLPSERVAMLLAQLLTSLADAHAHGLVHRDIKPANIFAARLGTQFDFVKVLDFGLVTAAHGNAPVDETRLTQNDTTSGTPAYLAPEVATGDADIGPAVDIYAAGCVAYYLLTGQLVFEADSAMQMVLRHVREQPVPPSAVTELPVNADLERLVMRMLEKNPRDRPTSAQAIACELKRMTFDSTWDDRDALRWWSTHAPELTTGLSETLRSCELAAAE